MKQRFKNKREKKGDKLNRLHTIQEVNESDEASNHKDNQEEVKQEEQKNEPKVLTSSNIADFILSNANDEDVPDWSDLSMSDKLKLFNEWNAIMVFANILVFIGSIFNILTDEDVSREAEILIGFGSCLAWFSLCKNYENVKCYNVITNTISNSGSILTKSLIGISPVYIGLSFFAL